MAKRKNRRPNLEVVGAESPQEEETKVLPKPPGWMSPAARGEWKRVVRILDEQGMLEKADKFRLESYCVNYGNWVLNERALRKTGPVYKPSTKDGSKYLQEVPYVTLARKYLETARIIGRELGLKPDPRVPDPEPDDPGPIDPLEELLSE